MRVAVFLVLVLLISAPRAAAQAQEAVPAPSAEEVVSAPARIKTLDSRSLNLLAKIRRAPDDAPSRVLLRAKLQKLQSDATSSAQKDDVVAARLRLAADYLDRLDSGIALPPPTPLEEPRAVDSEAAAPTVLPGLSALLAASSGRDGPAFDGAAPLKRADSAPTDSDGRGAKKRKKKDDDVPAAGVRGLPGAPAHHHSGRKKRAMMAAALARASRAAGAGLPASDGKAAIKSPHPRTASLARTDVEDLRPRARRGSRQLAVDAKSAVRPLSAEAAAPAIPSGGLPRRRVDARTAGPAKGRGFSATARASSPPARDRAAPARGLTASARFDRAQGARGANADAAVAVRPKSPRDTDDGETRFAALRSSAAARAASVSVPVPGEAAAVSRAEVAGDAVAAASARRTEDWRDAVAAQEAAAPERAMRGAFVDPVPEPEVASRAASAPRAWAPIGVGFAAFAAALLARRRAAGRGPGSRFEAGGR